MSDAPKKRPQRRRSHWLDDATLAAFFVVFLSLVASVFAIGMAESEDRLGCGLNELVNGLLAYPRPCR